MKTTVVILVVALGVTPLVASGCLGVTGGGGINLEIELLFFDTTPDSGYVLLTAAASVGAVAGAALNCTGFIQASGTRSVRDSTFVERETEDRVVSETCVASLNGETVQGGASIAIPALGT
jgi:hypothetical protein